MTGLRVCYGKMESTSGGLASSDDGGLGWRILVDSADAVLPIKFLRERDAEIAMHAIADLIDWTMDGESVTAALRPRVQTLRRLMTESLQW